MFRDEAEITGSVGKRASFSGLKGFGMEFGGFRTGLAPNARQGDATSMNAVVFRDDVDNSDKFAVFSRMNDCSGGTPVNVIREIS